MHPELVTLQQNYNRIVDDVQNGHMPYEQALSTLANMSTPDADGWLWSIDPDTGNFVRSQPGGPAQPADPSGFVPAQVGPRTSPFATPTPPATNQWGASAPPAPDQWSTPPSPYGPDLSSPPTVAPNSPFAGPSGSPFSGPSGPTYSPPSPGGLTDSSRAPRQSLLSRIPGMSPGSAHPGKTSSSRPAWLRPAILVVGVVLVVALVVSRTHHTTTTTVTTLPPISSSTTTTTPASSTGPIRAVPSSLQLSAALHALVSGSPSRVHQYVIDASGTRHLAYYTALYTGFVSEGLTISTTGAHRIARAHEVVSTISVYNNSTHLVVARAAAQWRVRSGRWQLVTWPNLRFVGP